MERIYKNLILLYFAERRTVYMRETGRKGYQNKIKEKIKNEFPECRVHRLNPNEVQGIPDLVILCPGTWATLETKKSQKAKRQPNQPYYVDLHKSMAFSSFVSPENEKEVFEDLHKHFEKTKRKGGSS